MMVYQIYLVNIFQIIVKFYIRNIIKKNNPTRYHPSSLTIIKRQILFSSLLPAFRGVTRIIGVCIVLFAKLQKIFFRCL